MAHQRVTWGVIWALVACMWVAAALTGSHTAAASDVEAASGQRPVTSGLKGQPLMAGDRAGLEVALRQSLFDYAAEVGQALLDERMGDLHVPPFHRTLHVPLIGDVHVLVRNITARELNFPPGLTAIRIEQGFFHFTAAQVSLKFDFEWEWRRTPLHDSGRGTAAFEDGFIDVSFAVTTNAGGSPQVKMGGASVTFDDIDIGVESSHLSWLYGLLLLLFHNDVYGAISNRLNDLISQDIPLKVNEILETLPSHVSINGLPFHSEFQYALYTANFVLGKGFVDIDAAPVVETPDVADAEVCPFHVTPLGLDDDAIAGVDRMVSLYVHESIGSCVLWALHRSGTLHYTLTDGDIPQIRLISDLFGALLPGIAQKYPHASMQLEISAIDAPVVEFSAADQVATIRTTYDSKIYVLLNSSTLEETLAMDVKQTQNSNSDLKSSHRANSLWFSEPTSIQSILAGVVQDLLQYSLEASASSDVSSSSAGASQQESGLGLDSPMGDNLLSSHTAQHLAAQHDKTHQQRHSARRHLQSRQSLQRGVSQQANEDLQPHLVAHLTTSLNVSLDASWTHTTVKAVDVHHEVVESEFSTPTLMWDLTVRFAINTEAPKYPLQRIIHTFVQQPVVSRIRLADPDTTVLDGWYALSSNLDVDDILQH